MQIILHPGMPKAGSTSIQISINKNREQILERSGIFYRVPDNYHNNHSLIYHMVMNGQWPELRSYVQGLQEDARQAGATKVLISAERLFLVAGTPDAFSRMLQEIRDLSDDDLKIVLIIRSMRNYIKSYIVQLMNNGSLTLDDRRLATWSVELVKAFWRLEDRVTTISFDDAVKKDSLVDRFCVAIGCDAVNIPETRANVTAYRNYELSASLGLACKLMSLSRDVDVNSEEIDLERTKANDRFDAVSRTRGLWGEPKDPDSFVSDILEGALNEYIDKCLGEISEDDRAFYDELASAPMSWNYPKSMNAGRATAI